MKASPRSPLQRIVSQPRRVQLSRAKGWRMPENTVKVSRPGPWGNPWRVGRDGDAAYCVEQYRRCLCGEPVHAWPNDDADTEAAIRLNTDDVVPIFLAGKNLACWCALDAPCHADVLLRLANADSAYRARSASED